MSHSLLTSDVNIPSRLDEFFPSLVSTKKDRDGEIFNVLLLRNRVATIYSPGGKLLIILLGWEWNNSKKGSPGTRLSVEYNTEHLKATLECIRGSQRFE